MREDSFTNTAMRRSVAGLPYWWARVFSKRHSAIGTAHPHGTQSYDGGRVKRGPAVLVQVLTASGQPAAGRRTPPQLGRAAATAVGSAGGGSPAAHDSSGSNEGGGSDGGGGGIDDGGGGGSMAAHAGWERACADFLAQALDVSSAQAAGWLDKAARKNELAAAKQASGGEQHTAAPAVIRLAEVQQLLGVLSSVFGMQPAGMAALLRKWPRYLACEPAQPLGVARFLRQELGLTAAKAAAFALYRPVMLCMAVEELRQRRGAWQRSLGLSGKQLERVLRGHPRLLTYSVSGAEQHASALVEWCSSYGWTCDAIAGLVSAAPELLGRSTLRLQTNFDRLMAARGLSQQQAVAAISAWPEMLVMNMAMPSKVRKLTFLQRVIRRPVAVLARSPSYLAYSLETRIAPRTCFRLERGMDLGPTLSYLRDGWPTFYRACACTEAEYAEWLAAWRQTPDGVEWGSKADAGAAQAAAAALRQPWTPGGGRSGG